MVQPSYVIGTEERSPLSTCVEGTPRFAGLFFLNTVPISNIGFAHSPLFTVLVQFLN